MKYFVSKNSKLVVLLLSIIIGIIVVIISWNYWQNNKSNKLKVKESIKLFEDISVQLQNRSKEAMLAGHRFANENKNIYGVIINIEIAKIAVEKNDIATAENALLSALSTTTKLKLKDLNNLINIRLARVQLALNKLDQAFVTLNQVKDKSLIAIVEDIRGDIFLKKGDNTKAIAAYYKGIESNENEMMKTILKLKFNSVSNQR